MATDGGRPGRVGIDRRTLLKTTGVAASASLLGVQLGSIQAASTSDHFVVLSDTHFGSPWAYEEETKQFLSEDVPALDPDALVLAGDTFEFWWRGESSVLLEHHELLGTLQSLHDSGISVSLVAGNHDRRLVDVGLDDWDGASPGAPWQIGDEFVFESGGEQFVVRHGDGPDPLQYNAISRLFCRGDDAFGKKLVDIYNWFDDIVGAVIGESGSANVGATLGADDWQTVGLSGDYDSPVVFTSPVSYGDDNPVHARVNNEEPGWFGSADSFDLRLERRDDPDATHPSETVSYVVLEAGKHVFGDVTPLEVGRVHAVESTTTVSFDQTFEEPPLVFAEVQTAESDGWWFSGPADPAVAAVEDVSTTAFDLSIQGVEAGDEPGEQDVGYLAIEASRAAVNGSAIEPTTFDPSVVTTGGSSRDSSVASTDGSAWFDLPIRTSSAGNMPPFLLARQAVDADGEAAGFRYRASPGSNVEVRFQGDGPIGPLGCLPFADFEEITASSSSTVDASAGSDVAGEEWEALLDDLGGDVDALSSVPEEPPSAAGSTMGNLFGDTIREALLEEYPDSFVLFGHTHVPGLGDRWANTGSWTARGGESHLPKRTYVEILDGDVTVWNWTESGREVLFD